MPLTARPRAVTVIALIEILIGIAALGGTLSSAAHYTLRFQFWIEIAIGTFVVFTGLGLLRRRRWAHRTTLLLLALVFLVTLGAIGVLFERGDVPWFAWLLPLLLPVLGAAVLSVRRALAAATGSLYSTLA